MGQICSAIVAAAGVKSEPHDWIPSFDDDDEAKPRGMTEEEGKAIIDAYNAATKNKKG